MTDGRLDTNQLARIAVAIVDFQPDEMRRFVSAYGHQFGGSGAELADERLRETLLQCHVFCGFPRTLASLDILKDAGLTLAPPAPEGLHGEANSAATDLQERGRGLFDLIYGEKADGIRQHLDDLEPTFARWIAEHAYGRVMTRPGLSAPDRELIAVAMLAAQGHERQLASHARGAVRAGATGPQVIAVLDAIGDLIPEERLARAHEIVRTFAKA